MKRTSSNSLRSASWTWHISAQILCVVFLSLISPFHLRLALSGSILPYLPPLMTGSTESSPSSQNTKPETLQGQCCCLPNSGLSGPSCASVPLPMPDSKRRCAKYVVKPSRMFWNSHSRNLNAFYRFGSYSHTSSAFFSYFLWYPYHVVSNEMKRTSPNSFRSAWWTWHISAPILCVVFLSLISPFHLRLALSRSILPYLPPSWPVPQDPHHPHKTPSLSPCRANAFAHQIHVCQGRVLLQSLCQCLTANKDVQNMWWNHLRFIEIHIQEISTPSTACSHTSAHTDISCQCGLQWNEKNKLKFTQICIMDLAYLSTNPLRSLPFTHCTISPSTSSVWIHIALPPPLMTGSSESSPSSKHQASGPMLLLPEFRFVRVELCFNPSANAWQ